MTKKYLFIHYNSAETLTKVQKKRMPKYEGRCHTIVSRMYITGASYIADALATIYRQSPIFSSVTKNIL